jgi:tRNA-modifying protein YgfZ
MLASMPSVHLSDRVRFTVSGEDAVHFLQTLITTDLDHLDPGTWKPGALLTAQGKVQFAFLIAREVVAFAVETDSVDAAALSKRLGFYKLRSKVTIGELQPVSVTVCWGDDSPAPSGALRDMRFGEFYVWRSAANIPAAAGLDDWNLLRIRHGVAEPHSDFAPGDVFAHDINFDQTGGLAFRKGCYVGQEVVSRMHHRNTARRRVMVAEGDTSLEKGVQVFAGAKPAGLIGTSSGQSGLALVRLDRIRDAMDAGEPVRAGEVPVTMKFPLGVTFTWPQGSGGEE